jgi:multicomponent Na+:H+ antiporter subunit A
MVGVLVQLVLGGVLSTKAKGWLAFGFALAALGAVLGLAPTIIAGQVAVADGPFAIHMDGLSLVFALMASGIGSAILLYSIDYMAHEPGGVTRFYALMLTFIAGLIGLVTSASLLAAYLCWEIIGLCSYLLVGFWYRLPAAANGARKVLVMTHIPGYALLIGILILYRSSGTFLWTDPKLAASFTTGVFLLMLAAAMAKSVLFPLHTWIPEAMNAPTPVSALLHSACYVKAGVYLVARLYSIAPWHPSWNVIVLTLGCVTMLVGAFFALTQTDLKRLLAFSTISQLGYIVTALGIGTPMGAAAAMFYVFSHGLFKGTLFMCAGAIQHAAGTRDLRELGGLGACMPHTLRIWLVAAAAIIGVPLTNGFVAKWLLFDAALGANAWAVVIVAWLVSIFTAFYMLKATVEVFFGEMPAALKEKQVEEAPVKMRLGMGFLAVLCVLFGIAPQLLLGWLAAPAAAAMNFQVPLNLSFLGLHTVATGAPITAGALFAVVALLVAGAAFAVARPAPGTTRPFTGGDPLPADNSLGTVDFSDFAQTTFQPVYVIANPDPLYERLWHGLVGLAGRWNALGTALERRPYLTALVAGLLLAAVIWLR